MLTQDQRRGWRRRGRPLAAAALALTAAVAAGCTQGTGAGAGPGGSPVASLPGHHAGPAATAQPLTQASSDQGMISFARCMNAHGVHMADPVHLPGHAGLSISLPPQDAATHAAYAACIHFIAKIIAAKEAGAAREAAPHLAALTRYAQCMRGHDIAMLDPTPQGELSLGRIPGISTEFGRYSPQFRTADAACRHLLPPGVHDDGTGP
jgi:hypothetical protein